MKRLGFSAIIAVLVAGAVASAAPTYLQDWESGVAGWASKHGSSDPVVLVTDPTSPAGSMVHKVTRTDSGGNYFSPIIPLIPGQKYVLGAWINWVSGGTPFIGVYMRDAAGNIVQPEWLIGQSGYPTGDGTTVTPVDPNAQGWTWYQKSFIANPDVVTTQIRTELFGAGKGGNPLAFFDGIQITQVPVPSSLLLCGIGLSMVRRVVRRKRRA